MTTKPKPKTGRKVYTNIRHGYLYTYTIGKNGTQTQVKPPKKVRKK